MLFNLLNNKYTFPAAVVLFGFLCYQAAIKKTIAAWQLNRQFKNELGAASGPGMPGGFLARKQKNLQKIVDRYSADSNAFRSAVLTQTAMIAEQQHTIVRAVPIQEPALQSPDVATEKVSFSGNYFQLLQTLQKLEQTDLAGLVRAVRFEVPSSNAQRATPALEMSVYLQKIKK